MLGKRFKDSLPCSMPTGVSTMNVGQIGDNGLCFGGSMVVL